MGSPQTKTICTIFQLIIKENGESPNSKGGKEKQHYNI